MMLRACHSDKPLLLPSRASAVAGLSSRKLCMQGIGSERYDTGPVYLCMPVAPIQAVPRAPTLRGKI